MKKILSVLICAILSICLGTTAFAADVSSKIIQPEKSMTDHELTKFFNENNIPQEKQEVLLWKLENDILWDCYNEDKLKLVPEEFSTIDLKKGDTEKYYRFEDGSFIKLAFSKGENGEVKRNTISPRGEAYGYGTTYVNHYVTRSTGTTSAGFYASFFVSDYNSSMIYTSKNSNGVYNSPFGGSVYGFGATGNPSMEMIRERESYGQAALFRMYWFTQVSVNGSWAGIGGEVPIGGTCNLYLGLKNSKITIASTPVR